MSELVFEKPCTKCKSGPQPLENFHKRAASPDGLSPVCKQCALKRSVEWQKNNRQRKNANGLRWKIKTGYDTSEHARQLTRERRVRHRKEAIEAMGGQCECCGLADYIFICFDHVGGWGSEHRRTVHANNLPSWLKKHGYPKGDGTVCQCGEIHGAIRLLCYSCNMSVAADPDGICAHKRTEPIDYSHLGKKARYGREWRARLRKEVLIEYGGRCQCPGCSETNFAFLSVEHVGGWGGEHRKVLTHSATLNWLRKQGFPKGGERAITVTCFNCNMAAAKNEGICPHIDRQRLAA